MLLCLASSELRLPKYQPRSNIIQFLSAMNALQISYQMRMLLMETSKIRWI